MLNNAKLGVKLALGFAVVLLLVIALGLLAIFKMNAVSSEAARLKNQAVPSVEVANDVERQALLTMYNLRGYVQTGDEKYLKSGCEYLDKVDENLKQALTLAKEQKLDKLDAAATEASKNVAEYRRLLNESVTIISNDKKDVIAMDANARAFMDNAGKYLESQSKSMLDEMSSNSQSTVLNARFDKVTKINDIINLANNCRIANFKARDLQDPSIIEKQLAVFKEMDAKIQDLLSHTKLEANRAQLAVLQKAGDEYEAAMARSKENMQKLKDIGVIRGAAAEKILEQGKAQTLDGVKVTKEVATLADSSLSAGSRVMTIGLVVVVCLGAIMAWLITLGILKPVKAIVNRIKDIAQGEGDLTARVTITTHDEIGELAEWFNTFVDKVHTIIRQVSDATREVASAATEIAASSEQMSSGMREQTGQAQQVSAAIEEMSSTVIEVARKSADAAGSANTAGQQATEGGHVVTQTIEGMQAIAVVVNESAASILELGKRGEQIGNIISVINDIADQTNLLALNAAIEAARAGEHGRGFAVVADEVRKLAERTTHATKEVAESITAIQRETGAAVQKMNAGTERVGKGVVLAQQAGNSLETIVAGAQTVSGMIQSIAAASEQQSAAAEQIARNVEAISAVTRQSSDGASQAAAAATQLSAKSEQLQHLVGQFKI
jgi:methyl-accepting chemotaxis protein